MKKNRILKLGLLALALTLVTASLVSGTFAKYVTTVTGTGTVQVARWRANLSDGTTNQGTGVVDTVVFDLFKTMTGIGDVDQTPTKRVAPGTSGSFVLSYTTDGTEVDHDVTLTLTKSGGTIPANMTFTVTPSGLTATPAVLDFKTATSGSFTTSIPAETNGATGSVTVTWKWPIGATTEAHVQDTIDGETLHSTDIIFNATFEAVQTNSSAAAVL